MNIDIGYGSSQQTKKNRNKSSWNRTKFHNHHLRTLYIEYDVNVYIRRMAINLSGIFFTLFSLSLSPARPVFSSSSILFSAQTLFVHSFVNTIVVVVVDSNKHFIMWIQSLLSFSLVLCNISSKVKDLIATKFATTWKPTNTEFDLSKFFEGLKWWLPVAGDSRTEFPFLLFALDKTANRIKIHLKSK